MRNNNVKFVIMTLKASFDLANDTKFQANCFFLLITCIVFMNFISIRWQRAQGENGFPSARNAFALVSQERIHSTATVDPKCQFFNFTSNESQRLMQLQRLFDKDDMWKDEQFHVSRTCRQTTMMFY